MCIDQDPYKLHRTLPHAKSLSFLLKVYFFHIYTVFFSLLPPPPLFFGIHGITKSSKHAHVESKPPGFYQGSMLDMDRDGLSHRAALSEGWGDGACMALVVQAGLIFTFASG